MAYQCDNCGKRSVAGVKHKHHKGVAGGRWSQRAQRTDRMFRPNLHVARLPIGGEGVKMLLCTKCLRTLKEKYSIYKKPLLDIDKKQPVVSI